MNHQLREREERGKRPNGTLKTGSLERKLTDDSVVGDEIDPAEVFDPEEVGVDRRDDALPRP